ncbi:MAG: hypothetical protein ACPK7O_01240 [Methanobacterium sp.]
MEEKIICPFCKKNGKEIEMELENDTASCSECDSTIILDSLSLERIRDIWEKNAKEMLPNIRLLEPQDIGDYSIYALYEDVYHTLLIGRYSASIVLMGIFVEAIVKERIRLKTGVDFRRPFGPALNEVKTKKLMDVGDIRYLNNFKNETRNPYQHIDDKMILENQYVKGWPIKLKDGKLDPESLKTFNDDIRSGKIKPVYIHAADTPAVRRLAKEEKSKELAIKLFNEITDFLISAKVKYFNSAEYEDYLKKYGSGLEKFKHHEV